MRYWLMKSEPGTYSIEDLARDGRTEWDGVRNYQARNMMRDDMRVGDPVLFYHSNAEPPGVAGLARVASAPHADETAFDPKSRYHDPRSSPDAPTWMLVDVEHVETFPRVVSLDELKANPKLAAMRVVQKGNRLSITEVTKAEHDEVRRMAASPAPREAPARKAPKRKSARVKARVNEKNARAAASRKKPRAVAKAKRGSARPAARPKPARKKKGAPAKRTKKPGR